MGDDALTQDVDLRQLLDLHAEAFFQAYHAPIVGLVNDYTAPPGIVDAQPVVAFGIEGVGIVNAPVLRSVPVLFPGGSVAGYTYPLTPGTDTVALVPQDADLATFITSGAVNQQPQSSRRFSLSDALAFPLRLRSGKNPLPATAFAADSGVLWGKHRVGSSAATKPVALKLDQVTRNPAGPDAMSLWMTQVETALNILAPGAVVPLSVSFNLVGLVQASALKLVAE